ncbi:hypothetical protein T11_1596 [Trichinella zimbabwensis]|uniref:Uncharacterized protein n=1 Tax=Trichinella zimbabwensis TaxID=268475 RepID=A0A0V1HYM8_9BILA|nr:hypothetical protein T11_1596 [Trichinella zimbabwensis]
MSIVEVLLLALDNYGLCAIEAPARLADRFQLPQAWRRRRTQAGMASFVSRLSVRFHVGVEKAHSSVAYRRKRKLLPRHMRHAGRARDAIPRQLYFCYAIFARALWRTRVSWCSATAGAAVGTTAASCFGVLLARSFLIIYRPRRYHEEEPRQQQPERNGSVGRGSNRLQLLTLSCGTWQGRIPSIVDG